MTQIMPDIDPAAAVITWMIWGSTTAAIAISSLCALLFSRKGRNPR